MSKEVRKLCIKLWLRPWVEYYVQVWPLYYGGRVRRLKEVLEGENEVNQDVASIRGYLVTRRCWRNLDSFLWAIKE